MVAGPYYLSLVASDRHFAPAMYKVTNSTFVGSGGGEGMQLELPLDTTGSTWAYIGSHGNLELGDCQLSTHTQEQDALPCLPTSGVRMPLDIGFS